ncbi:hypothetical protein LMG7974_00963 [Campylobacter majalis]|uniref:Septicolysin n=1 Tax=Campylobacter majalis TaxID=2790656 RepID=A0ABM8Q6C1_9BACT|nr:DIP1984 family protein [Campylobacter majalis]CAD7288345.1 hypothetical protein LMG7974_00963 [Campylobacter majalis]
MKLAQALIIRGDLQMKISELSHRLSNNATKQEGEKPAEDPKLLLKELDTTLDELENLITKINLTNAQSKIKDTSLTQLLAKKEILSKKITILNEFINQASSLSNRASKTEIKILSTVDVTPLRAQSNRLSKELRELDMLIQESNWSLELI